jgi:bacterioferritin
MIREDLVAERGAIESYGEVARYSGENDPTTRRLMEAILRDKRVPSLGLTDWVDRKRS